MSAESDVREVSAKFYTALSRMAEGEAETMAPVWSHGPEATTMHPIGGREEGWEAVNGSFNGVASAAQGGQVRLDDQSIHVAGDVAWESGIERGHILLAGERVEVDGRVTNIYHRGPDGWKLVHHHADTSSAMMDVVRKLQGGG